MFGSLFRMFAQAWLLHRLRKRITSSTNFKPRKAGQLSRDIDGGGGGGDELVKASEEEEGSLAADVRSDVRNFARAWLLHRPLQLSALEPTPRRYLAVLLRSEWG